MRPLIEDLIENTLVETCRVMPFEKITVKLLCEKTGISKQTFYNHYRDKYEVAARRYEKEMNDKDLLKGNYSLELLRENMNTIWKHRGFYRNVLAKDGQNSMRDFLREHMISNIEKRVRVMQKKELTPEQRYLVIYHSHGWVWTTMEWLNGDLSYTADEIAGFIYQTFPEFIIESWKYHPEETAD